MTQSSNNRVKQKFHHGEDRIICYYLAGNQDASKCLLFLNGLFHGQEAWIKQQRYQFFRANYKQIFLDYRGVGNSKNSSRNEYPFDDIVLDVKSVLEAERQDKAVIVGYSVGGLVALRLAVLHPCVVEGLVLLNTAIKISYHAKKLTEGLVKLLDSDGDLKDIFSLIYPWQYSRFFLDRLSDFDMKIRWTYAEYNKNRAEFKLLLKAMMKHPGVSNDLSTITAPILLVGSDHDNMFPVAFQEEMLPYLKSITHHVIQSCGHASFVEKHDEVNAIIECYLSQMLNYHCELENGAQQ